jgi:hypothetical protein
MSMVRSYLYRPFALDAASGWRASQGADVRRKGLRPVAAASALHGPDQAMPIETPTSAIRVNGNKGRDHWTVSPGESLKKPAADREFLHRFSELSLKCRFRDHGQMRKLEA